MSAPKVNVIFQKDFLDFKKGQRASVLASEAIPLIKVGTAVTDSPVDDALIKGMPAAVDAAVAARKASFGDFLQAVARRDTKYLADHYNSKFVTTNESDGDSVELNTRRKAAMAESSGVTGGYTVPPSFANEIMGEVSELSVLRPLLQDVGGLFPMSTGMLLIPTPDITTVQATGVSPFFGGTTWTWVPEDQARTETEPAFKQVELKAWELSGYLTISNPLAQDSPALGRYLLRQFSQGIAWFEEYAWLQGNGAAKPQGIISANASIAVTRQTAGKITFQDISTMLTKLPPGSLDQAVLLASPTALTNLLQLMDGSNRAVEFHANTQKPGQKRQYSLAGLPLHITEKLPPLGTKGDFLAIDPRFYIAGEHSMIVAASEHIKLLTNQLVYRVVLRADGQPLFDKPITLQDGSTQVSGLVVLD